MDARIPEDSVLKRHFVAEALGDILATMPPRPTDSVLRRHFDASAQAGLVAAVGADAASILFPSLRSTVGSAAAPAAAQSAAARPAAAAAAPASTPQSPSAKQGGGGLFGWLKRLLGG